MTALLLLAFALALPGCAWDEKELVPPQVLVSPYDSLRGDVLWAVVPLANESGVSLVDTLAVSDSLCYTVGQVRGLAAVPMNRTLAVMNAKGMVGIRSPQEAKDLATALGVDGLIVGTITAWDPYNPPKIGLTLVLHAKDGSLGTERKGWVDPKKLSGAYNEPLTAENQSKDRPAAVVSEHLDAASHEVLMDLQAYARGRHDKESALGWKRYTASMELYTQFASYWTVRRLLEEERLRLARPARSEGQVAR